MAAVSGGSDSLALLWLLKRWRDARAPLLEIVAVTVDHGLRPEAATEAAAVGAICAPWGVSHEVRRWSGEKPTTGIAAGARLARYRLLGEAADARGADIVLTGHTMDDQAETVAMRQARGDGRGAAGMAGVSLYQDRIWIVRPLLALRRERLRECLRAAGQSWIDDPSNENLAAERVRVRKALASSPGEVERLARCAVDAAARRSAEAQAAAAWLERAAPAGAGFVMLPKDALETGSSLLPMRALLAAIGGASHLPGEAAALALIARVAEGKNAALSRTLVRRGRDGFVLSRERRGSPPAVPGALMERSRSSVAPWIVFLPGFDIALRNAVARLVGAEPVPEAPA